MIYSNIICSKLWGLQISGKSSPLVNEIKQLILNLISKSVNYDFVMNYFKNKYKKLANKFNLEESKFIACPSVCNIYDGAFHEYKDFFPSIELEFEDTTFSAPNNYDAYLKRLYGDYMTPPAKEKQIGHHTLYYLNLDLPFKDYDAPYIKK